MLQVGTCWSCVGPVAAVVCGAGRGRPAEHLDEALLPQRGSRRLRPRRGKRWALLVSYVLCS